MAKEGIWIALADWRPVVLIVEDELLLRISAAEMVADAGFPDIPPLLWPYRSS
jgi:hypothetical protein